MIAHHIKTTHGADILFIFHNFPFLLSLYCQNLTIESTEKFWKSISYKFSAFLSLSACVLCGYILYRISSPPPLTPPTRGGGKTFPPPRWGRSGEGAELFPLSTSLVEFKNLPKRKEMTPPQTDPRNFLSQDSLFNAL